MELIQKSKKLFIENFQFAPEVTVYAAGRVNIIGEHTDYNQGFVMPCAINYGTAISAKKRDDHIFNVISHDLHQQDTFSLLETITKHPNYKWTSYIRGVVKYIQARKEFTQGADILITGNIPLSAGLSSSASLEIATGKLCQYLGNLDLTDVEIALIGQEAENKFVGCQCGNMDQLISILGKKDHLLMIDCRNLATTAIKVPEDLSILIVNSNTKHDLVDGEYNTRRAQCEMIAKLFQVPSLRDISIDNFNQKITADNSAKYIEIKRAKHVIFENQRVLDAVKAIQTNNMPILSKLMAESHQSMKDDFEITTPEIDYLVDLISTNIGFQGGVRMTGGGFGGCVVALVPNDKIEKISTIVKNNYYKKTGIAESIYICKASDGVKIIKY